MSGAEELAVLDRTALDALSEMTRGDDEFLAELIDTFLEDGPKLLSDMRAAAADQRSGELRRAAHTLKSNCRTFGATSLGDVCQEIEELAATNSLDEAGDLIKRVLVEFPAVVAALKTERKNAQ